MEWGRDKIWFGLHHQMDFSEHVFLRIFVSFGFVSINKLVSIASTPKDKNKNILMPSQFVQKHVECFLKQGFGHYAS